MIINLIISIFFNIFSLLLSPLSTIGVGVNFILGLSYVYSFFDVIIYILPFQNLIPLFAIVFAITNFKIAISIIKTIWNLIPVL